MEKSRSFEGTDGFKRHLELYHGLSVHDDAEVHKWCCFRKLSPEEAQQTTEEHIKETGKLCVEPARQARANQVRFISHGPGVRIGDSRGNY